MKRRSVLFLVCIQLAFSANVVSQNRSIKFEEADWNLILEKAKKENKVIFLDCYTSWCGPCKWMAENVFNKDTVADFYNSHFINASLDMEKGRGPELVEKYGISSYPTMLYLDSNGKQLHRTSGKTSSEIFIENGGNALDPEKQLLIYEKRFWLDVSNSKTASIYLKKLKDISQPYDKEVTAFFESQKDVHLLSLDVWPIIYNNIYNTKGKMNGAPLRVFNYLLSNKDAFIKLHGQDSVETIIDKVYNYELYFASKEENKNSFEELKKSYSLTGTKLSDRVITYADLHYYESHKDWENYAKTSLIYVPKYAAENAYEMANDAFNFYKYINNRQQLEIAETWAEKAVQKSPGNVNFNETYASLLFKLDKKAEAKEAILRTIDLIKKNNGDFSDLQKMLDTL